MSYSQLSVLYFLVGYIVALIFAVFFTKILIIQLSEEKENKIEIELKSKKSCVILDLKFFKLFVILANTNDEISGSLRVFQLKYGWLFLLSGLFWPAFLIILGFNAFGVICGKRLPPKD